MPNVEITKGDSAGQVCECDEVKANRLVAVGVAKLTDKPATDISPKKPEPLKAESPMVESKIEPKKTDKPVADVAVEEKKPEPPKPVDTKKTEKK